MKTLKTIILSFFAITFVVTGVYALDNLTPSATPGEQTHYTLSDIYNKILNINSVPQSKSPPDFNNPIASFNTLSEIYAKLIEAEDFIVSDNIREGVNMFGVEGGAQKNNIVFGHRWSIEHSDGGVSWQTALDYCSNLTEGGHEDWRLPTSKELINAYLTGVGGFVQEFGDGYWSNTVIPDWPNYAYFVRMLYGNMFNAPVEDGPFFRARCVRGGNSHII